jgi:hypothetical protein
MELLVKVLIGKAVRKSTILEKFSKDALEPFRPASIDLSTQAYIGQQTMVDLDHPLEQGS